MDPNETQYFSAQSELEQTADSATSQDAPEAIDLDATLNWGISLIKADGTPSEAPRANASGDWSLGVRGRRPIKVEVEDVEDVAAGNDIQIQDAEVNRRIVELQTVILEIMEPAGRITFLQVRRVATDRHFDLGQNGEDFGTAFRELIRAGVLTAVMDDHGNRCGAFELVRD